MKIPTPQEKSKIKLSIAGSSILYIYKNYGLDSGTTTKIDDNASTSTNIIVNGMFV